MTSRPSCRFDHSALAPRDSAALVPPPRTRSPNTRLQRGPPPRYANCGRAIEGHQSRRHTGYVTALGRDCRGCLRIDATRSSQHLTVCATPARASTSGSAPPQAPRGTQRDEPAQVGRVPPQTTPLLSVWGCKWGSNPLSSTTSAHSTYKRERTQVRLAARVVHRGGFGTCVPGAWTG